MVMGPLNVRAMDRERERASLMVAHSSASPSSWRHMTRTLGALFAGSAVTLSATVLHGGSLLLAGDETGLVADPSASPAGAQPQQLPPTSSTVAVPEPGQAAPWTPGATPQWGSPLKDLPVRRAPVLDAPQHSGPAAPAAIAASSAEPSRSGASVTGSAAPTSGNDAAGTGATEAAPQAADPQRRPVDGLLGSVFHATKGISR